ncbi:Hyaluronidase [Marssonina coronariae]|uniref:Hyaluronidase n=1 Tax=Diplocarpon coronariae TaxID=2795749 RepID=A0A218YUF2_9HELO|nr:Hyaluronidase [Marssonina coronariae]
MNQEFPSRHNSTPKSPPLPLVTNPARPILPIEDPSPQHRGLGIYMTAGIQTTQLDFPNDVNSESTHKDPIKFTYNPSSRVTVSPRSPNIIELLAPTPNFLLPICQLLVREGTKSENYNLPIVQNETLTTETVRAFTRAHTAAHIKGSEGKLTSAAATNGRPTTDTPRASPESHPGWREDERERKAVAAKGQAERKDEQAMAACEAQETFTIRVNHGSRRKYRVSRIPLENA